MLMQIPRLETERLILRAFCEADLDAYAEMCADPEVMRYIIGQPLSRSESWRNMRCWGGQLRGYGMWAVEELLWVMIGQIGCWQPEGWPGFEVVGRCDELTGAVDLQQLRHEQR